MVPCSHLLKLGQSVSATVKRNLQAAIAALPQIKAIDPADAAAWIETALERHGSDPARLDWMVRRLGGLGPSDTAALQAEKAGNRTLTAEALAAEVFDTVAAPAPFDIKLEEVNSPHLSATLQKFSYGLRATGLVLAVEALDIVSQEEALSLAQAVSVKDRAALTSAIDTITALPQAMKLAAEGFDVPEDIAVALDRWAGGLVTNGGIINLIWDLSKAPNDIFANRLRGIIGDGRRPRAVTDLGMEAA